MQPLTPEENELCIESKATCLILLRGYDATATQQCYAYLAIPGHKLNDFIIAQRAGALNVHEFGKVIDSGWGDPAPEVQQQMFDDFYFSNQRTNIRILEPQQV